MNYIYQNLDKVYSHVLELEKKMFVSGWVMYASNSSFYFCI